MFIWIVTVKVADYEFSKEFHFEDPAIKCFNDIAYDVETGETTDTAVITQPAAIMADTVTLKRVEAVNQIGNPNRR